MQKRRWWRRIIGGDEGVDNKYKYIVQGRRQEPLGEEEMSRRRESVIVVDRVNSLTESAFGSGSEEKV